MVRFGIVGCGNIAQKFARDIRLTENAKLVAVSARSHENALKYKEQYNVIYTYPSYLELALSNEIDAVYIATPHNFHFEQAIMFMKHKKHVLVEKPIAVNQKQLEEMIQVAKENHVLLMEAMWTHFLPSTQYINEMIHRGDLGNLKEAYIPFGYSLINDYPEEMRLLNPELAGGSILDIGVYPISFFHLIQKARVKTIEATATFTKTGVDASCDIHITNELKAKIHIQSSIDKDLSNNAKLVYEKGTIEMIDFFRAITVYINKTKFDIPYEGEGFVHQIRSFSESIQRGETENYIMTFNASMRCMKTMDEVRRQIGLKYPFE